jgi:hypothetical protein
VAYGLGNRRSIHLSYGAKLLLQRRFYHSAARSQALGGGFSVFSYGHAPHAAGRAFLLMIGPFAFTGAGASGRTLVARGASASGSDLPRSNEASP